jgi:alpha-D-xyloside xylohydrolase
MKQGNDFMTAMLGLDAPEAAGDVYLPEGEWVDLWTGERLSGDRWLKGVVAPLEWVPVYVKHGAQVRVCPHEVLCTDEMDLTQAVILSFDDGYRGLSSSLLEPVVGL